MRKTILSRLLGAFATQTVNPPRVKAPAEVAAEKVASAKRAAREGQEWWRIRQLRPTSHFTHVRPAPPKPVPTWREQRDRRLSTRASRRRRDRAASLAMSGRAS